MGLVIMIVEEEKEETIIIIIIYSRERKREERERPLYLCIACEMVWFLFYVRDLSCGSLLAK